MARMPDGFIDAVITSPPYNLGEGMEDKGGFRIGHSGSGWQRPRHAGVTSVGYATYQDNMPYPSYVEWQRVILKECWRVIADDGAIFYNHKPRIVKGSVRLPTALIGDLPLRQIIIWNRGSGFNYMSGAYMPAHEWILVLAKPGFLLRDKSASGVGDVWTLPADNKNTEHPASFPIALPKRILETTRAELVYDPFIGSGTTAIAAHQLKRRWIGSEISSEYVELANKRLEPYLMQEQLF